MSKSALGRSLGHLLRGMKTSPPKAGPELGLAALLRPGNGGANTDTQLEAKPETQAVQSRPEMPIEMSGTKWLVRVSLVLADVVLLGLVALLFFGTERPLGFLEILIGVMAV